MRSRLSLFDFHRFPTHDGMDYDILRLLFPLGVLDS